MTKIENTTISYWALKSVSHQDLKYESIAGIKMKSKQNMYMMI